MEEIDVNLVDDNKGLEVIILNDSEIFYNRKIGKRKLNNIYTISWNCKNRSNCNAALLSRAL